MQHLYSNLRVSKNYALGTKLSVPRVKKRIEKPSEKVRNNKEMKTVHVRDENIGISLFSYLFRG